MKLLRRQFLNLATGAAVLPMVSRVVYAQSYPLRPVRMIVGYGPGQSIDIVARLIGKWLSERLTQQFIIENRPGAGGNLGAEVAAHSPPDGYTLLVIGANNAINATLYEKLNFNLARDIVPVAGIYRVHQVMVVDPSFPARTVSEFIAYAKANPGKINFASAGNGSVAHVTGELFKMLTGINMQHVTYRAAPQALSDLLGGQVQVMFDNLPTSIEHIKAGRLRALGVSSPVRSDALPDIPTVGETVAGFETSAFAGIGAPKNTPVEIINRLNSEVNAGLATTELKAFIAKLGATPLLLSPTEFGIFIARETEKWGKVVKFSGAKPD